MIKIQKLHTTFVKKNMSRQGLFRESVVGTSTLCGKNIFSIKYKNLVRMNGLIELHTFGTLFFKNIILKQYLAKCLQMSEYGHFYKNPF